MPELRQNIITRDWVIIAKERALRPNEFASRRPAPPPRPSFDPTCPFCPGNEKMTRKEIYRVSEGSHWQVRVIDNKYPALVPEGERVRSLSGVFRSMAAVGYHEVIVEHPRHDLHTALYSPAELGTVLKTYRARYHEIRKDPRVEAVIIFRNHGEAAGTSLPHPHAQLVATPIVPSQIRARVEEAVRYFDDTGECVFCRTLREELLSRERIVCATDYFVAFIPYAALSPFHMWIYPRRHVSSFDESLDGELDDLAVNLRSVLLRLYHGLGNPDLNYSIRSLPLRDRQTDYFHWYLAIVPRVTRTAGFELGSGMFINSSLPEESAKFLRSIKIPEA